jgi:hypothetical protein
MNRLGLRTRKQCTGLGENDHPTPWLHQAIPPEGLASAGTSGLHRRWSLEGNSPQPGLAKTCDPNVDSWPRQLSLPSPGPGLIPQRLGDVCSLFIHWTFTKHLPSFRPHPRTWGCSSEQENPDFHGVDSSVGNSLLCMSGGVCITEKVVYEIKEWALENSI